MRPLESEMWWEERVPPWRLSRGVKQPRGMGKCETRAGNHSPGAQSGEQSSSVTCASPWILARRHKGGSNPTVSADPQEQHNRHPQLGPTWLLYNVEDGLAAGVLKVLEAHHAVVLVLVGAVYSVLPPVPCRIERLSEPSCWGHVHGGCMQPHVSLL